MATHSSTSPAVQIVKGDQDGDRVFDAPALKELINAYCNKQSKAHYKVVSVIGAQNSGKSTLMNYMFNTQFQMLDGLKEGSKATTKGIWAAVCNNPPAIVFDIEGSDGQEHQDDPRFENQSAVFAFEISDVVLFNINVTNLGRMHGANVPLLRTSFQERRNHKMDMMTKLIIAVRDYTEKTMNADHLRKQILSKLDGICENVKKNEMLTISEFFKTSVEFFPHFVYEREAFQRKCNDMIHKFFHQGRKINWHVDDIPTLGEMMWTTIQNNKRLDMPSYWGITSRDRCERTKSSIILDLHQNELYQSLTTKGQENPSAFDAGLQNLLHKIMEKYDDGTQNCEPKIATMVAQTLRDAILQKVEPIFKRFIRMFMNTLYNEAAIEILEKCDQTWLDKRDHAKSIVSDYIIKFKDATEGLSYNVDEYRDIFKRDIELIGDSVVDKAKAKLLRDMGAYAYLVTCNALVGAATGIGLAATGGLGLGAIPAVIKLSKAVVDTSEKELEKSKATYIRATDEIVSNVKSGKTGSGKGAHSGASSSSSK